MEVPGPPESGRVGRLDVGGAAESLPKMQLDQIPAQISEARWHCLTAWKQIRGLLLGELNQRILDSGSPGTDVVRGKNRHIY